MSSLRKFLKKETEPLFRLIFNGLERYRKKKLSIQKQQLENRFQSVGYGFKLNGNSFTIRGCSKIIIGNNVHIGNNIFIAGEGGLVLGDNTHISRSVTIYTVNHNYKGKALPYDETTSYKPVVISENVWIGMNVSILPGVKVGKGAIIGLGSVVNRDIKDYEIVGNTSLSHLKFRSKKHYNFLNSKKHYGGVNGKPLIDKIIKFNPSYLDNRECKIVFVLGTGRSGTNSIVDVLNQNPKCKAFHENIHQLIRISTNLAYHPETKSSLYNELSDIFKTKIWQAQDGQTLIHSDQRLWNLVPFLMDYFPNSKFVHLKRDVYSCVKSMYARGWYTVDEYPKVRKHDWAKYRLKASSLGLCSKEDWENRSQAAKCTWYWTFINNSIEAQLQLVDKKRTLTINLDELNANLSLLSEFVSEDDFEYQTSITNQINKKHLSAYKNINEQKLKTQIDKQLKRLM